MSELKLDVYFVILKLKLSKEFIIIYLSFIASLYQIHIEMNSFLKAGIKEYNGGRHEGLDLRSKSCCE